MFVTFTLSLSLTRTHTHTRAHYKVCSVGRHQLDLFAVLNRQPQSVEQPPAVRVQSQGLEMFFFWGRGVGNGREGANSPRSLFNASVYPGRVAIKTEVLFFALVQTDSK